MADGRKENFQFLNREFGEMSSKKVFFPTMLLPDTIIFEPKAKPKMAISNRLLNILRYDSLTFGKRRLVSPPSNREKTRYLKQERL